MPLQARSGSTVPKETARVAQAVFPKGNPYLTLRDELETVYDDNLFGSLFPSRRQAAESPDAWRWSPCRSLPKGSLIDKPLSRCGVGLTGSTYWAWNWRTQGSIFRC